MIPGNRNAWNKHAQRYLKDANFSFDVIDYGDPHCNTDETLQLLPDVAGKKVLELGCGGANVGIALARRGADVTCVDISEAQLDIAQKKATELGVDIKFVLSSLEELDYAKFKSLDLVISVCALMYVSEIQRVFASIHDTLNPGGIFVFSTNDPTFYSIASKFLWKQEKLPPSYFYDGPETWKWEDDDDFSFTTYRHPIDFYINTLVQMGFVVERFHQLHVHHAEVKSEEDELKQLYPRIMVFKCRKHC